MRAAVKYGRAVAHVAALCRHLRAASPPDGVDVEVSVDETDVPTTPLGHAYVATELRRLGVEWVSLAPRFVGRFEKGVDYIGRPGGARRRPGVHAAVARALGPYKLSLHSGSDKFTVYPAGRRGTPGLVHLKTAGTSYLEALARRRGIAPEVFRDIYGFAYERYETDRASYHVSASLARAPAGFTTGRWRPAVLLDQFDARQMLHVTFGSVLTSRDAPGDAPLRHDAAAPARVRPRGVRRVPRSALHRTRSRPFAAPRPSALPACTPHSAPAPHSLHPALPPLHPAPCTLYP